MRWREFITLLGGMDECNDGPERMESLHLFSYADSAQSMVT
jgi:hypothetical protein